jgi:putative transposase
MPISDKLIDQLLEGNPFREEILGEKGLLKELPKRVGERALEAEMESHLSYA